MTKPPKLDDYTVEVSFLTVNYHQADVTLALLASLQHLSFPHWECVVVNNGTNDPDLKSKVEEFDRCKYVESEENLGFAGGNNLGLPHCEGRFIFFINNDTEVSAGLLEPLLKRFDKDHNIGILSPKIIFDADRQTIQYAGATELSAITLRNKGIGYGLKDEGQYDASYETAFAHGAAMVVPRKVIDEVGPMSEEYFLYYEEYDWSMRIRKAGYKIVYCGESVVYHKESVSTGVDSPFKIFYLNRNRLLFARKNLPAWRSQLFWLYYVAVVLPVHGLKYALKGQMKKTKALYSALQWNLSNRGSI